MVAAAATQPKPATALLTKRGTPLGNAWLAAHLEKKLHKGAIIKTDVHGTVAEVIETENGQLALRISGHLLLGIVRIFSRQVDYLLDDASEAVIRVRLAFNPTAVDLPPDASARRFDEVTLPANAPAPPTLDLDLAAYANAPYETLELPALGASAGVMATPGDGGASARAAGRAARDHTLADADEHAGSLHVGVDDPFGIGAHDGELGYQGLGFGPTDDFELFDAAGARGTPAARASAARRAAARARGDEEEAGATDEAEEEILRRDASARRSLGGAALGGELDLELELARGAGGEQAAGRLRPSHFSGEIALPPGLDGFDGADGGGGGGGGYDGGYDALADAELLPGDGDGGGLAAGTVDVPLDDVMLGADGTPSNAMRTLLLAAADEADARGARTPSVVGPPGSAAVGARQRARGRRGAGAAAARSAQLILDAQTLISGAVMKEHLADAAPTLRAPHATHAAADGLSPARAGAAHGAARTPGARAATDGNASAAREPHAASLLAARAKAIASADAATLFAAPVFAAEPAELARAYKARPYLAPAPGSAGSLAASLSGGKRRRGAAAAAEDAAAAADAAARLAAAAADADAARADADADGARGDEGEHALVLADAGADVALPDEAMADVGGYAEDAAGADAHVYALAEYDGAGGVDGEREVDGGASARLAAPLANVEAYGIELPTVDGAEGGADASNAASGEQRVGWSTRTQKMFAVLRATFDETGDDALSYKAMAASTKPCASRRRVVAGCFQELLFLATHNLVSLSQHEPYADIAVHKTERFDRTAADVASR
ncbi:hypothetical protein KFE25_010685 [Diacronema lutheri]|uniref:Rad21/Rec8-like protein N-terminal domain-containing protein n=1 Tax=Diacronema lutheri TaxID=2081491 RepID=A0A8J5XB96_DIALT|nr:hypothetical protein KFE25_010685 [Diacronema lutheri]